MGAAGLQLSRGFGGHVASVMTSALLLALKTLPGPQHATSTATETGALEGWVNSVT